VGGDVWIASEYIGQTCTLTEYVDSGFICGGTRTALANWDTRISEVAGAALIAARQAEPPRGPMRPASFGVPE